MDVRADVSAKSNAFLYMKCSREQTNHTKQAEPTVTAPRFTFDSFNGKASINTESAFATFLIVQQCSLRQLYQYEGEMDLAALLELPLALPLKKDKNK